MMHDLPFAPSCENNKQPILEVLGGHFLADGADVRHVLEIASGTGQHAEYFARHLPHLHWQCTELAENLEGLNRRLQSARLPNLPPAQILDVMQAWNFGEVDYVFTANSLHIMPVEAVIEFFSHVGPQLRTGGRLAVYGPFKYDGDFTTPSNAQFDLWLKSRDPRSGVRDFERVNEYAEKAGLQFLEDNAMPANNQMLIWQK